MIDLHSFEACNSNTKFLYIFKRVDKSGECSNKWVGYSQAFIF